MKPVSIDQFLPSVAIGDGVTNSSLFIQSLLIELGYSSDIYSFSIPPQLSGQIHHASGYRPNKNAALLYHHSMGHDHGSWLLNQPVRKQIVYHNITPAEFFPSDSALHYYASLGRRQLSDWQQAFDRALALSPLNHAELGQAGYTDIQTLPLLIDSRRLDGERAPPRFLAGWQGSYAFYLSVGRLVENKRQNLLIEAFYHLLQQRDDGSKLLLVGGVTSEDYTRGLQLHIHKLGLAGKVHITGKCSDAELRWLYRNARQYWCASAHEGFCMPLIEANHASLPIIALASSNIPDTLGESGLLLKNESPEAFAMAAHLIDTDEELQKQLVSAGLRNLARYERNQLRDKLAAWLVAGGY